MGLVDTTVELAKFAGKLANPELVQMALKANVEALAVSKENLELQMKVAALERRLALLTAKRNIENKVHREAGLVILGDELEPYCSHCWDAQQKLIHLVLKNGLPKCPACDTVYSQHEAVMRLDMARDSSGF
jgi:Zn finger protein HypA/HybF involved in hydrogenase expression